METSKVRKLSIASVKDQAESEYEKDIWDLRNLGIVINQSRADYKINFTKIEQPWLRDAAKKYAKYNLSVNSASQATIAVLAIKHLSRFLGKNYPLIKPSQITRSIILDFFINLLSLELAVSSRRKVISNLGIFFDLCIQESWLDITQRTLVHRGDIPKEPKYQPRYIPNEVVEQLNKHLDLLPPYIMRLVLILQATGRRVSEICTLPFNPLLQDVHGDWFLKHFQSKMKNEATIPISRETVAVIQEQQQCVRNDYDDECQYLFPQPPEFCKGNGKRRKGKPIYQKIVNTFLDRLAEENKITDTSGKVWNFQSHQFRHTIGTSMINNGVPVHIVQRFLGHESVEMTMRYVHIHDQTLKEEFTRFQGKVVDVTGKVIESINPEIDFVDLQWFKKNTQAQALPNGSCALPTIMQSCPHANACLTCTHFRTTAEFLDQHKQQLKETEKIIEKAKANAWSRQVEMNEKVANNLQNIINSLEASNGN